MDIELDEVVVMDISDDALEQAAGGALQGGWTHPCTGDSHLFVCVEQWTHASPHRGA